MIAPSEWPSQSARLEPNKNILGIVAGLTQLYDYSGTTGIVFVHALESSRHHT